MFPSLVKKLFPVKNKKVAYKACMKEYLFKTSFHGLHYIFDFKHQILDLIFWVLVLIISIVTTIYIVITSYQTFLDAPTATSQIPTRSHISTIPFPAVGICSGNRISRRAALSYSSYIFNRQNTTSVRIGRTIPNIFNNILILGSFYDMEVEMDNFNTINVLHTFFTEVYGENYPIDAIMQNLSMPCSSMIKKCRWNDEEANCSLIFQSRKTYSGQCCIFNYQRPTDEEAIELKSKKLKPNITPRYLSSGGSAIGLSVLIEPHLEDISYSISSNIAPVIFVFDPQDFPDYVSGTLSERYLDPGTELYISVFPEKFQGSMSMYDVASEARGCLFQTEIDLQITNDRTSFGECNLACRLKDIIAFCGCYPHYLARLYNESQCLLGDLSCLGRWKDKWFNSEPLIVDQKDGRSFQCPDCVPNCNYIKYNIQSSWGLFNSQNILKTEIVDNVSTTGNLSMVHVFFGSSFIKEYQQTVLSTSLDLLSILGGIFSLMLGISLTSAVELFFYLTGKLFTIWTHIKKDESKNKVAFKNAAKNFKFVNVTGSNETVEQEEDEKNTAGNLANIYWNEIASLPQPRRRLF